MAQADTAQQIIDVVTPAAGESVTEGTILEWHVKVGDEIKADATIVEISTDKVDVELPSPASGVVTELLVEEGDTVTVGQVIARIAVGGRAGANGSGNGNGSGGGATELRPPQDRLRTGRPGERRRARAAERRTADRRRRDPRRGRVGDRGHDPRMAREGRR